MPLQSFGELVAATRLEPEEQTEEIIEPVIDEPIVQAAAVVVPTETEDILRNVPREALPYVQAARTQEKRKLYGQITQLTSDLSAAKTEIRRLRSEAASQPTLQPVTTTAATTEEQEPDRLARLETLVQGLATSMSKADTDAQLRARRAELSAFKQSLFTRAAEEGVGYIASLVSGDTEEDIESSFEVAKAEYALVHSDVEERVRQTLTRENETRVTTAPRVVRTAANRPVGVPSVAPQGSGNSDTLGREEIKALTSIDAIRDGSYAANRKKLLAAVRRIAS